MPVITIANQKGGVGKTTTTMNLGVALSRQGLRVLLIDNDPQANLTSYLGVRVGEPPYESLKTLDEAYLAKHAMREDTIGSFITSTVSGVDLVAADRALSGVEYYLFSRQDKEMTLSRFIAALEPRYDAILIDNPPSLNLLTINALAASRFVLIPVQPEFFSLEGVVKIREAIEEIRSRWNPKLEILGVLPTQVSQRRKLTDEVLTALRGELGETLLGSMIHDNVAVTESTGHAQSVLDYDPSSRGAADYRSLATELLSRMSVELISIDGR